MATAAAVEHVDPAAKVGSDADWHLDAIANTDAAHHDQPAAETDSVEVHIELDGADDAAAAAAQAVAMGAGRSAADAAVNQTQEVITLFGDESFIADDQTVLHRSLSLPPRHAEISSNAAATQGADEQATLLAEHVLLE